MSRILSQMMVIVSIAIVVFLVLSVVIRPKKEYVLKFRPTNIERVSVESKLGDFELQRLSSQEGIGWVISQAGSQWQAESKIVDIFLAVLARITIVDKFSRKEMPPDLGGTAVFRLQLVNGEQLELQLGKESPSGTEYYMMSSQSPDQIFIVPNSFYSSLLRGPTDFWSRQTFALVSDASQVVFNMPRGVLRARNVNGTWEDEAQKNSQAVMNDLITTLRSIRFANYFDESQVVDLGKFGLTLPNLEVDIIQSNGKRTTYAFSLYNGKYYMHIEDLKYVFLLPPEAISRLLQSLQKIVT